MPEGFSGGSSALAAGVAGRPANTAGPFLQRDSANSDLQSLERCDILNIYNALMEKVRAETDAAERVVTG